MKPTLRPLPSLKSLKHVHVIGVGGTLMGAFAAFLRRRDITVTGSDQNVYPPMSEVLSAAGVQLFNGYDPKNLSALPRKPDLVVVGNVISASNPEVAFAFQEGYTATSLPEAMEKLLLRNTRNLVVAGTHGKTTTSSLLAHTLSFCQRDPSYFIGGVPQDLPHAFHVSGIEKGKLFVLEGDEYDTAFWDKVPKFNHYLPDDAILTSVEFDHADIYPDFAAVRAAFAGLVSRVRKGGRIIACMDYAVVGELCDKAKVPVISYGSLEHPLTRFTPGKVHANSEGTRFEIRDAHKVVAELSIRLSGTYNVLNAIAVWIECRELGLPEHQIAAAFARFSGVKRRQEVRGDVKGVTVIDDFAHHPTAVRETLQGLRARYAGRRLVAVFEPRSATSRRKVFQADYARAFRSADLTYIATPFDQSRIPQDNQFSSDQLVADLKRSEKQAFVLPPDVDSGVALVAAQAAAGDVIAVLSNGGFGGFLAKLLEALQSK